MADGTRPTSPFGSSRSQPCAEKGPQPSSPEAQRAGGTQTHFGDPCVHCDIPQDDVAPGPCVGDPSRAKVIGYASLGVRPDGVEHFRFRLSTNEVREKHAHISEHAPYYHFGRSATLTNPPPYDARLKATGGSNA